MPSHSLEEGEEGKGEVAYERLCQQIKSLITDAQKAIEVQYGVEGGDTLPPPPIRFGGESNEDVKSPTTLTENYPMDSMTYFEYLQTTTSPEKRPPRKEEPTRVGGESEKSLYTDTEATETEDTASDRTFSQLDRRRPLRIQTRSDLLNTLSKRISYSSGLSSALSTKYLDDMSFGSMSPI